MARAAAGTWAMATATLRPLPRASGPDGLELQPPVCLRRYSWGEQPAHRRKARVKCAWSE